VTGSADAAETLAHARSRVLAAFRTRRDLVRWSAVTEYVDQAYTGVDELRRMATTRGSAAVIPTTEKALASVVQMALRADDSNGEIGGLADTLLALHAELCLAAPPKPAVLVTWLIDFRFDGTQDYFEPDIADYAAALGAPGLALLRERLDALEAALPPQTTEWDSARWLIASYRERVAVASGDTSEVIAVFGELTRTHRLHDLAKALAEVGAIDQAITYAERATLLEDGWQAERAGHFWCELLQRSGRSEAEIDARQIVFDRWPTAKNALALAQATEHSDSSVPWSSLAESVYAKLETQNPSELITTLLGRGLPERAWDAAERLTTDVRVWTTLVAAREKADPAAVVPALIWLIHADLEVSKPQNYRSAVGRLKQLRRALTATDAAHEFPLIVAELRDQNRRRPTLLQAFDRAGF
jgi:tetratricopeptide (TPR) repeat protein